MTKADWADLIPPFRGALPSGVPLCRTDPGGDVTSPVAVLGLYPSAGFRNFMVDGTMRKLPWRPEATSFQTGVSSSARHLDADYLSPLGLPRNRVMLIDIYPFLLLNRPRRGRSMGENVRAYETLHRIDLGLVNRPSEQGMLDMARQLPGNIQRLRDYFDRGPTLLVLTLGIEAAAFIRGESYKSAIARDAEGTLFYQPPHSLSFAGRTLDVVHLVHPGFLLSKSGCDSSRFGTHQHWCRGAGTTLVHETLQKVQRVFK